LQSIRHRLLICWHLYKTPQNLFIFTIILEHRTEQQPNDSVKRPRAVALGLRLRRFKLVAFTLCYITYLLAFIMGLGEMHWVESFILPCGLLDKAYIQGKGGRRLCVGCWEAFTSSFVRQSDHIKFWKWIPINHRLWPAESKCNGCDRRQSPAIKTILLHNCPSTSLQYTVQPVCLSVCPSFFASTV